MDRLRSYGDPCGLSRALDLVGERWSLLVVRELLFGPKRFTDLRSGLPGASPNVLAQRLRELEGAGVVAHHHLPAPAAASVYELTTRGRALEPAIIGLARFGSSTPRIRGVELSPDALMLALKTTFDPERARGMRAGIAVHLGEDQFRVILSGREIDVARGTLEQADVTIEASVPILRTLVFGGCKLADAQRRGEITFSGKKTLVSQFLRLFPLTPAA